MTLTNQCFVGFSDLRAIRLTCKKCESALNIPMKSTKDHLPETCPHCGERWFNGDTSLEYTRIIKFRDAIHSFMETEGAGPYSLHIETLPPR